MISYNLATFWKTRTARVVAGVLVVAAGISYYQQERWRPWYQARASLKNYDFASAKSSLEDCLALWPQDAEVEFALARTCRRMEDLSAAQKHLNQARRLGYENPEVDLEQLLIQAQTTDLLRVEALLARRLAATSPGNPLILEALIRGYLGSYQWKKAYDTASTWARDDPGAWYPRYLRGLAVVGSYENMRTTYQWLPGTIDDLRLLVSERPQQVEVQFVLAILLEITGEYSAGISHYQVYVRARPDDSRAVARLCRCQRWAGQGDEALALLVDWQKEHSTKHPAVFLLRGQLALDAGHLKEAENWALQAHALAGKDAEIVHLLAQVYRQLGDHASAEQFERQKKMVVDASAELARAYQALEEMQETGAANDPSGAKRADLYYDLGCAYLELDNRKGLIFLRIALQYRPDHAAAQRKLAGWKKGGASHVAFP
jgi:Flp pilus assembly protein TadD